MFTSSLWIKTEAYMVLIKINPLIPTPIFSCVREYRRFFPPFGYNHVFRKTSP